MRLHSFFNSSTSFRVRIALALKGLAFEHVPVNLRAGAQQGDEHLALNPSAGVPVLEADGLVLTQSLAIIDWLDSAHPLPRLIPQEPLERARVLEFALGIACDIHPINNQRVLQYLKRTLDADDARRDAWYRHWVAEGLGAAEALLLRHGRDFGDGPFCFGAQPTLADCCLVPQMFNARRMGCETTAFARLEAVCAHCMQQAAFQAAAPMQQPDFVAE